MQPWINLEFFSLVRAAETRSNCRMQAGVSQHKE